MVYEATGYGVIAAFNAGNLEPVAVSMAGLKNEYPVLRFIVCADDDVRTVNNPGITKATEAAKAIGGTLAIPNFGENRPEEATDFNDLSRGQGPEEVMRCVQAASKPGSVSGLSVTDSDEWPEVASAGPATADSAKVSDSWPTLREAAYHGLAGEFVRLMEPHTEADPVALLSSFLSEFGTMVGRGLHLLLDGTYHPLLIWPVLVGKSSKSRKGTSSKRIEAIMKAADSDWNRGQHAGTLSSGEGLVWAVRDAEYRDEPEKDSNRRPTSGMVRICVDAGVTDKRLFLVQSEFGSVLRVMARDGNSLSGVLRDAWDGSNLAPMTKGNRQRATAPHIGIVGHVTQEELLRNLTDTEACNGFGNRFLWLAVKRSKLLPFGSTPDGTAFSTLAGSISAMLSMASRLGPIDLTISAQEAWIAIYAALSRDRAGLVGSLLGRAEATVMRTAGIYALLDGRRQVDLPHLKASLALWEYSEASAALIFGDSTGDPIADAILKSLRASGELDDSQISALFNRNVPAVRLSQAKDLLSTNGLASPKAVLTNGRARTLWTSTK
jgi:hypothetical protein